MGLIGAGVQSCRGCGRENAPEARFCNQCGGALVEGEAPTHPAEAERKQISVLFSDLSGYTALSERLDPEESREILAQIFQRAADVVGRYGGRIEKFVGDAIMALFGVPHAHEDDPVRAVRAALELHDAVAKLAPGVEARTGAKIALHSGVNTGLVVTGELHIDRGTAGPLGDTINVAARLMGLAEPGEIWVGAETRRLVAGAFAFDDLGERPIKGRAEPVRMARVRSLAEGPSPTTQAPRRHAVFVGRHEELGTLLGALERLRDGEGGAIAIGGEAGTGKTRLIEEFRGRAGDGVQWLEGRAYLYAQNTPYFALIDLLNRAWNIAEGDSPAAVRKKVEAGVSGLAENPASALPVIARLYDIALPDAPVIDRETWQDKLRDTLRGLIDGLARRAPTVICLQDLHWADSATVNTLRGLVRDLRVPALFVCNHRSGFTLGEGARQIELRELSPRQTRELLVSLLEADEPPAELVRFVEERSDGNPFYVEEVVQSLVETRVLAQGDAGWTLARPLAEAEVPSSIRGLIASRIDRLDDTKKRVLREAAVVGREFLYDVIAQVSLDQTVLAPSLDGLEAADLIRAKSREPDLEYIFKHALTQEVAYDGLLKAERKKLHERTAYAMERLLSSRASEFVETLAWHFLRGGVTDKAVNYLALAGKKCIERYALGEATNHFREAYLLLEGRERTPAEDRALVELLNEWSLVHYYLGTFGEMRERLEAHRDVAARVGDPELEGFYLGWLGLALYFHEEPTASLEALDRALALGEATGSERLLGYANSWKGFTLFSLGRTAEAIAAGEAGHVLAQRFPDDHYLHFKSLAAVGNASVAAGDLARAQEIGETLLAYAEKTGNARAAVAGYTCLGLRHTAAFETDKAIEVSRAGQEVARDPCYREWGLIYSAIAGSMGQRYDASRPAVDRLAAFAAERVIPIFASYARFADGATLLGEGHLSAGMAKILAEHERAVRLGTVFNAVWSIGAIGAAYSWIARRSVPVSLGAVLRNPGFLVRHALPARRKARAWLERALEEIERTGVRASEGSVHLELALLLEKSDPAEARSHLERAIAVFSRQGAESELANARDLEAKLAPRARE